VAAVEDHVVGQEGAVEVVVVVAGGNGSVKSSVMGTKKALWMMGMGGMLGSEASGQISSRSLDSWDFWRVWCRWSGEVMKGEEAMARERESWSLVM